MSTPSPPAAAVDPSAAAAAAALLADLQLQTHPLVDGALASAQKLVSDRRYDSAESEVKSFMASTQASIKAAAAASQPTDLPTLSQLMTTFLPFLRTIAQLKRESENAEYDFHAMQEEVNKYKAAQSSTNAKTRPPHAEYVHPQLKLAVLGDRNRGVVVSTPGLPDGCAAPASSSDGACAAEPVRIEANTTLMVSKAVGFVTAPAVEAGSATTEDAHEEQMATALVTLLALKMGSEARLIPELYKLDAGERYEEDRSRRLAASDASPLEVARKPYFEQSHDDQEPDPRDLEIDLARLALIVARNAFAPPQPADSAEEEQSGPRMRSTGLWITCSLLNHGCRPNAHWFCVGDYMVVRSLRDILPGEEVLISYTGFDAKTYSARQTRCKGWGFDCTCSEWCDAMVSHPTLQQAETHFVNEFNKIEPQVHELVDRIHASPDESVMHRNALHELKSLKEKLEKLVDQFKSRVRDACANAPGGASACEGRGGVRDSNESGIALSAPVPEPAPTTGKGKKKAANAAAASSASSSASSIDVTAGSSSFITSTPAHTRALLIHLAAPLTLLALCHVSLHDAATATAKSYRASLKKHEQLSLESIDLLGRQYGDGDETVIFAWFELLNTWLQFYSGGVEYRSIEEIKAVFQDIVVKRHCQQFGVKTTHFRATWMELMQRMGLAELMDE